MSFAMLDEAHKQPTAYKLVVVGEEEKVVGLHIIGEGSDEIMQGCKYLNHLNGRHADNQSLWLSRWELPRKTLMIPLLSVS
jgi:pyruvate/2-oxoglutarate dehydrogenase complex dihydrolipoamide dehydrogenase (E3) component